MLLQTHVLTFVSDEEYIRSSVTQIHTLSKLHGIHFGFGPPPLRKSCFNSGHRRVTVT